MSQTAPRSNPQLRPAWHQAFSQLRRELEASWFGFHGEEMPVAEKKLKEAA
jgi:hypothetical protein